MKECLAVEKIELAFGGVGALCGVGLELKEPQILGIIGPNGAGKTCLINCISGFYRPQKGSDLVGQAKLPYSIV